MASTAVPVSSPPRLRRRTTTESTPTTSTDISPSDSPRPSASSTSLSSLASESEAITVGKQEQSQKLIDGYGNEFEIPDFTIGDIHKAIPKHCFERSAATGLYYVARDIVSLGVTFYLTNRYLTSENVPNVALRTALWGLYTFVQGLFATGLWVLAHECGHQSFSNSKVLNDTVGWICHSSLLVPYFSWKISHGKHHKATGHMERDMVFVPKTREQYASRVGHMMHELHELTEETPIASALDLIGQQLVGWPMYLLTNVTGHNYHQGQREGRGKGKENGFLGGVNHFNMNSPLYEAKDAKLILLSDLGLAITGTVLFVLGQKFGWYNMFVWYWLPYLWVNHWLGKCFVFLLLRAFLLTFTQFPSLSFNIPIHLFPITPVKLGPILEEPRRPSIGSLVLLVDNFCMGSSRHMFCTTTLAQSHSITLTKLPKLSRK